MQQIFLNTSWNQNGPQSLLQRMRKWLTLKVSQNLLDISYKQKGQLHHIYSSRY